MDILFEAHIEESYLCLCSMSGEIELLEAEVPVAVASDVTYSDRRTDKRKREYLVPRILLKRYFGQEVQVSYSPEGAPTTERAFISISHSGDMAAVVINPQRVVAIDIEQPSGRVLRVVKKFLSDEELAFVRGCVSDHWQCRAATIYWSAKETLFKWLPRGDVDFCQHLYLAPIDEAERGVVVARQSHDAAMPEDVLVYFWSFPSVVLTVIV